MADKRFQDQVVFITGAAKGQGRAVALAFAREGAKIVGFDLKHPISYPLYNDSHETELEQLVKTVEALGSQAVICGGDVRNVSDVQAAVQAGIDAFGHIDILFNNAGIAAHACSWELSEAEWQATIDINLTGYWRVAKAVIPYMIAQHHGVIIHNSSVGGLRGLDRLAHYTASKYGVVGLTKSQAIELAPYGVRVISIHPSSVKTAMIDGVARVEGQSLTATAEASASNLQPVLWIEPEDVANLVLFLASDEARYIDGSQIEIDAGLMTR